MIRKIPILSTLHRVISDPTSESVTFLIGGVYLILVTILSRRGLIPEEIKLILVASGVVYIGTEYIHYLLDYLTKSGNEIRQSAIETVISILLIALSFVTPIFLGFMTIVIGVGWIHLMWDEEDWMTRIIWGILVGLFVILAGLTLMLQGIVLYL